jgi:3-hydroxyisobutyrate dehydrogenase
MNEANRLGVMIQEINYQLEDLEKDIWIRLLNGALKSREAFHTTSIATIADGAISQRTVVLRKVLPAAKQLFFHTDTRSHKWLELAKNNNISALFYDAPARLQLRIQGKAVLHQNDAIAETSWQTTRLSSRRCYLTMAPPSSVSDQPSSGLTPEIEREQFTLDESEVGKHNFGVVAINVDSIDWLWLHHAGHRRAHFNYQTNTFQWLIP